jgi:catechol 2,3-dioxygenase-like lactoylglutathione lyase family enzyme
MQFPTTGVHHITLIGSNRQATIDFYEGVLGMPFVFEQPNLDVPEENHLYFDPGDGNLITFFTRETRQTDPRPTPEVIGAVHHIAFSVSRETYDRAVEGLKRAGYPNSGPIDRGFMDSLYFRDPNGLLIEFSVYVFDPPPGMSRTEVFKVAHRLRQEWGDYNIDKRHLDAAMQELQGAAVTSPGA